MKLELQMRTENVDFDRYMQVYFSEDFNAVAMPAARLRARDLLHFEQLADGRELRKVRMVPDISLPKPVVKLLDGNEITYTEVTLFDPVERRARLDVESIAGELVRVWGNVKFAESGGGITLDFQGEVKVGVFGLGRIIEKIIVGQVQGRYSAVSSVLQGYLDRGEA